MTDDNPLEDLYMDRNNIDQQQLRDALDGLIGVDKDSGEPIFLEEYYKLDNKTRFVAQLLYRKATVVLGDRSEEEQGAKSSAFAETLESSGSAVQNYAGELDFVENDESQGGYIVKPYHSSVAIRYLTESRSSESEE